MHTMKNLLIIIVVLGITVTVFGLAKRQIPTRPIQSQEPVVCTQDVKQCEDGSYVARSGPSCEFAACPEVATPERMNFGTPYTLKVDQPIMFTDGFAITIQKIDDSRCKPGVQCIWAGELAPTLNVWGGALGESVQEVHLGTLRNKSASLYGYKISLNDATTTTATITVTK